MISPSPNPLPPSTIIAGVDEVGRGCLFGPVVACSCILPESVQESLTLKGIKDSKLLTPSRRLKLAKEIKEVAIDYKIGVASVILAKILCGED